jgi:hypothetical protein
LKVNKQGHESQVWDSSVVGFSFRAFSWPVRSQRHCCSAHEGDRPDSPGCESAQGCTKVWYPGPLGSLNFRRSKVFRSARMWWKSAFVCFFGHPGANETHTMNYDCEGETTPERQSAWKYTKVWRLFGPLNLKFDG